MKTVVIGGTGLIGSKTVAILRHQRPARVLRQSRRARSFLGNIRAIFGLRGQGKCVRTSMDDTLSRHGRDGAGAPIWRYAGTRTRAAVGGFRQRGPALPIRFSHGDLAWDQVAVRLLCIRCDVLRPISGSRRLESMDPRLFTMMLHEVEKRAIRSPDRACVLERVDSAIIVEVHQRRAECLADLIAAMTVHALD